MHELPSISIISPALNEAHLIGGFLEHLERVAPGCERIVVDGGSGDGTAEAAAERARVVVSAPGRGRQMNAGAKVAKGDVLWFLHVDSRLPESAAAAIREALADPRLAGGCFRLRVPSRGLAYRIADRVGNLGVDCCCIALGDHGIFARRDAFHAAGGYLDVPLMEDAEFYRRLRRQGRVRQLRAAIESSPRRWERNGPWRTTATYAAVLGLYVAGVPIPTLARLHRRLG